MRIMLTGAFFCTWMKAGEQDNQVMEYQRLKKCWENRSNKRQAQVKQLLQNVQRVLQPVAVRNPYAEYLQLPSVFKPRRTNAHYLAFIEVVTFYQQYQRIQQADQSTGEVYIGSTIEDIREANRLMGEILIRKSDELTGACRSYFEQVKQHLKDHQQDRFTNRSISKALRVSLSADKRHNLALQWATFKLAK